MQLEPIGTVLDNLSRVEKLGLISSIAADWIELRSLRNSNKLRETSYTVCRSASATYARSAAEALLPGILDA
jgi:hypothetical protein